jgi:hypothetical protein
MAAKHQLSCFPNFDYLNLELTTKKRIEKDSSKAKKWDALPESAIWVSSISCFWGPILRYVEVKKWPTICYNLMLVFFWIFWSRFSAKVFWLFFHYIIISVSMLGLLSLLLLKSSGCLR